jgi:hypothetical protein
MTVPTIPRLRWRPTRPADLEECFELLPEWIGGAARRGELLSLWRRLLDEVSITSTLVEDQAQPAGRRIQGWGAGLALSPHWSERLGLTPPALRPRSPVVPQIYAALLDRQMVLMNDKELGEVNARGQLQFFNLHYTQRESDLGNDYALAVLNAANEVFRTAVSGYWLQAMHFEACARDAGMVASAGFPQLPYTDAPDVQAMPDTLRPVFFGITREQARASLPDTSVRHAFEHYPPRFRLSASQRRLLWHAQFDDSDDALMDGKRGPEKRRQVLAYVRQRPEELRPWTP